MFLSWFAGLKVSVFIVWPVEGHSDDRRCVPEETFLREGIIQRDKIPGGWFVALAFCELSGLCVSAGWQEEPLYKNATFT